MQVFQNSLGEASRPCSPKNCPRCAGKAKFHKHGSYRRWHGIGRCGVQVEVPRFLCPRCGHTWSVIPVGLMPRRPIEVPRLEHWIDVRCQVDPEPPHAVPDPDSNPSKPKPPPPSQAEEGAFRRALEKLSERMTFLRGIFGQQIPADACREVCCFWRALRQLGPLDTILLGLARDFKTSLLGSYQSLRPHWEREPAPV